MTRESAGGTTGVILKRDAMIHAYTLGDTRPISLAGRLLDEQARGMVPVWPSTERYADRLVEGLGKLRETRGGEVVAAIASAPEHGAINWPERLMRLVR